MQLLIEIKYKFSEIFIEQYHTTLWEFISRSLQKNALLSRDISEQRNRRFGAFLILSERDAEEGT